MIVACAVLRPRTSRQSTVGSVESTTPLHSTHAGHPHAVARPQGDNRLPGVGGDPVAVEGRLHQPAMAPVVVVFAVSRRTYHRAMASTVMKCGCEVETY